MPLQRHYQDLFDTFTNNCTACGACISGCPIMKHTNLAHTPPKEVAARFLSFMKGEDKGEQIKERVLSCMECFKCTTLCPEGINPMAAVELAKGKLASEGQRFPNPETTWNETLDALKSGVTPDSFHRLTTATPVKKTKTLFFPGCNVYAHPEMLLAALDVMKTIAPDAAFLPGLAHCCGDSHLFSGEIQGAAETTQALLDQISAYQPDTLVLWCPTCHCRFETLHQKAFSLPFEILSLPQFIVRHMKSFTLAQQPPHTVTLHEPCKSAYTGVDLTGVRELLAKIPGITLKEMPRHGKEAACCGSGAVVFQEKGFQAVRDERLVEAKGTGADTLISVCHFCHTCFKNEAPRFNIASENYIVTLKRALTTS